MPIRNVIRYIIISASAFVLSFCSDGSTFQLPSASDTVAIPQITVTLGVAPAVQDGTHLVSVQSNVAAAIASTSGGCTTTTTSIQAGNNNIAVTGAEGANSACTISFRVDGVATLLVRDIPAFTVRVAPTVTETAVTLPTKSANAVASFTVTISSSEEGVISFPANSQCSSTSAGDTISAGTSVTVTLTGPSGAAFTEGTLRNCIIRITATDDSDVIDYVVGGPSGVTIDITPTLAVTAIPSTLASALPSVTVTTNLAGTLSYTGDCTSSTTSVSAGATNNVALRANAAGNGFDYGSSNSCTVSFASTADTSETVSVTRTFSVPSALTVATPTNLGTGNPSVVVTTAVAGTLSYAGNCDSTTTTVTATFNSAVVLRPSAGGSYAHAASIADCVITLTGAGSSSQSRALSQFAINIPFVAPTVSPTLTAAANSLYSASLLVDQSSADYGTGTTISYAGDCRSTTTTLTSSVTTLPLTTTSNVNFAVRNNAYSCMVTFRSPDGRTTQRSVTFTVQAVSLTGVVATIAKDATTVSVALTSSETGTLSVVSGSGCAFASGTTTAITANTAKTVVLTGDTGPFTEGTYTNCAIRVTDSANASADYRVGGNSGFEIDITPTLAVTAIPSTLASALPSVTVTTNLAGTLSYTGDCTSSTTSVSAGATNNVALRANAAGNGFDYGSSNSCTVSFASTADTSETVSVTRTFSVPSALTVATPTNLGTGNPSVVVTTAVAGTLSYAGNCDSTTTTVTATFNSAVVLRPSAGGSYAHAASIADCVITLTGAGSSSQSRALSQFAINIPFVAPTVSPTLTAAANSLYSASLLVDQSSADYGTGTTISYAGDCRSTTTTLTSSVTTLPLTTTSNVNFAVRNNAYSCMVTFRSPDGRTTQRSVTFTVQAVSLTGVVATIAKDATTVSVALTSSETGTLSVVSGSGCAFASGTTTAITANTAKTVVLTGDTGPFAEGTYTDCIVRVIGSANANATGDYRVGGNGGFAIDLTPTLTVSNVANVIASSTPSVTVTASQAGALTYSSGCYSSTTSASAGANSIALYAASPAVGFNYGTNHSCTITLTATSDNETATATETFTIPSILVQSGGVGNLNTRNPRVTIAASLTGALSYAGNCRSTITAVSGTSSATALSVGSGGFVTFTDMSGAGYTHNTTVANCVITLTTSSGGSQSLALSSYTVALPFTAPTLSIAVAPVDANDVSTVRLAVDRSAADYLGDLVMTYSGACRSPAGTTTSTIARGTSAFTLPVRTATGGSSFAASANPYACMITVSNGLGNSVVVSLPFIVSALEQGMLVATVAETTATSQNSRSVVITPTAESTLAFTGSCTSTAEGAVVAADMPATVVVTSTGAGAINDCVITATATADNAVVRYQVPGFTVAATDLVPTVTATTIVAPNSATDDRGIWVSVTSTQAGTIELLGQTCTSYSEGAQIAANTAMQIQLFDYDYKEFVPGRFTGCQVRVRTANGRLGVATVAPFTLGNAVGEGRYPGNTPGPKMRATATVNGTSVRIRVWSHIEGTATFVDGSHCAVVPGRNIHLGVEPAEVNIVPARGSAFAPGLHVCELEMRRANAPNLAVSFSFTIAEATADVYTGNAPVRWTDTGISAYINEPGTYNLVCDGVAIGDAQTVTASNAGLKTFAFADAVQGTVYDNCSIATLHADYRATLGNFTATFSTLRTVVSITVAGTYQFQCSRNLCSIYPYLL